MKTVKQLGATGGDVVRVTKAQAAETRERIILAAARAFRERGFDGIGVADLMKSVGLTHGGFYGHFESKEELMAQACQRAVGDMLQDWSARVDTARDPLRAITGPYLSAEHRDQPGTGCLMAALGAEAARQPSPLRRAFTQCFEQVLETLTRLTPGASRVAKRRKAMATFATLVGALVIARAVDDPVLSDEVLRTVAAAVESS